jgi:hypothetical protein
VQSYPYPLWVEDEMIDFNLGYAYDPEADDWRRFPELPVRGPVQSAVWTGEEIIAMVANRSDPTLPTGDSIAYAYDPDTETWRLLPPTRLRESTRLAWDGSQVIANTEWDREAASYVPGDDRWEPLPPLPTPLVRCPAQPARVGEEILYVHCDGTFRLTEDRLWAVGPPPANPVGHVISTGEGLLTWWSSDEHFNFSDAPVIWFQAYEPPELDEDLAYEDRIVVNAVVMDLPEDVALDIIDMNEDLDFPPSLEEEPRFTLSTPTGPCVVGTTVTERADGYIRRAAREAGVTVERWPLADPDTGLTTALLASIPPGDGRPHVLLGTGVSYVLDIACADLATAERLLNGVHR